MQTIYFYSDEKKKVDELNFDTLDGINIGICHRRIQENKPCFLVSFTVFNENHIQYRYEYFAFRFMAENLFQQLMKAKKELMELEKNAITA